MEFGGSSQFTNSEYSILCLPLFYKRKTQKRSKFFSLSNFKSKLNFEVEKNSNILKIFSNLRIQILFDRYKKFHKVKSTTNNKTYSSSKLHKFHQQNNTFFTSGSSHEISQPPILPNKTEQR